MRADPILFNQVKKGNVSANAAKNALDLKQSDPERYQQLRQGKATLTRSSKPSH
jgi:hypothetical protein